MEENKSVDEFITKHQKWSNELKLLRSLLIGAKLKETIKWGMPVYTIDSKNVIGIAAFKTYVGMWFYQGVFLKDNSKRLINAQEGKTKGMRQWRFTSLKEIDSKLVTQYIEEAIANQIAGKEIKPEKKPLLVPEILKEALSRDSKLSEAFDSMSLTYKREYAEYIAQAKREHTELSRIEKIRPMILGGIGLNDKYR